MPDFCKRFSMNTERRAALLRLLKLSADDYKIGNLLHSRVLDAQADRIIDSFYEYLLKHVEYSVLISKKKLPQLKETQSAYLRSFGVGFNKSDYFEHRLMIGLAHKKVGLNLGLYQCAYRELQQLMLNEIPDGFMQDGVSGRDLCGFIHKVTALDMTLAIEAYHHAHVREIEEELDEAYSDSVVLRNKMSTDSLTGVHTKDFGIAILEKCLAQDRDENGLCVIMADIDFFKAVNDTFGHLGGDEVLREIGKLLKSAIRDFDTVCRFGGEEFMIVLCKTTPEIALKVANRIRQLVVEKTVQYKGADIKITISQGLAVANKESTVTQLLSDSDKALYEAKEQGRDCVIMSEAHVTRS